MLALPVSSQNGSNSGVLPTRPTNAPPESGRQLLGSLDRYRLSCLLGRGGMAEVFLAAWQVAPEVVRPVVVKRLYGHFSDDPNLVRMFIDEARLVCQLDHENIVKTHEVGLIDDHLCLAMEYLEGQTLQQLMRRAWERGGLPVPASVHIASCVLAALRFAHEATDQRGTPNEIVHRDVSPQNIFVTNAGLVKVLDFGIAKAKSHEQRTSTGIVKGKFAYIAPEQAVGNHVDARADIWSLGVVLWEMLAGKRLFKADGEAATLNATMKREIPFLTKLRPEIPIDLALCVARALQRDPGKRYADADTMLVDVQRCLGRMNPRPDQTSISALMQQLFAEESRLQQQLVSDLILLHRAQTPASSRPPPSMAVTLSGSQTALSVESTETQALLLQLRRRSQWMLNTLVVLVVLLVVAGAWAWMAGSPRSTPNITALTAPVLLKAPTAMNSPEPTPLVATPPVDTTQDLNEVPSVRPSDKAATAAKVRPSVASRQSVRVAAATIRPAVDSKTATLPSTANSPLLAQETGFLTLDTTPWSNVSVKGRIIGQTPLMRVKLPVGTQVLTLRNSDLGIEMQYSVTIVADQTVVKRIGLK